MILTLEVILQKQLSRFEYLCFRFTDEKSDETLEQTADTVEDITQKLNPLDS